MSERINNEELNYSRRLNFLVSSLLTSMVTVSLEKQIKSFDNIRRFLTSNFLYDGRIKSGHRYLIRVEEALTRFLKEKNRFPNCLNELKLDITNLCAIHASLLKDKDNDENSILFYEKVKDLRNFSNHTTEMSAEVYLDKCNVLRKLIITCPHIQEEFKSTYLDELNYMIQNLLIIDGQSLTKKLQELEKIIEKKLYLMIEELEKRIDEKLKLAIEELGKKIDERLEIKIDERLNLVIKRVGNNEKAIKSQEQEIKSIKDEISNQTVILVHNRYQHMVIYFLTNFL